MKKELYNKIINPDFINKSGEIMKINSNQHYDVYVISEGDSHTITMEVLNYKYQIVVFSYMLDINELTYRDINGLFYDLNDIINKADPENYTVMQWGLIYVKKNYGCEIGEIMCCKAVYCNEQFSDIYRQYILKKIQRDSKYDISINKFVDVCEDEKYDNEYYLRCGIYVAEGNVGRLISGSNILIIPIGEFSVSYLSITLEYTSHLFPYPLIDDFDTKQDVVDWIKGLDEWYEMNDESDKMLFIDREVKVQKLA